MEEIIKLLFGVIVITLAVSISLSIITKVKESNQFNINSIALSNYIKTCNTVCLNKNFIIRTSENEIAKDTIFYFNRNKICFDYSKQKKCGACECLINSPEYAEEPIEENEILIKNQFLDHIYSCSFKRTKKEIFMECKG